MCLLQLEQPWLEGIEIHQTVLCISNSFTDVPKITLGMEGGIVINHNNGALTVELFNAQGLKFTARVGLGSFFPITIVTAFGPASYKF